MNAAGFDTGYGIWRLEQKDFELLLAQSSTKSIVQKRHKNKILKNTPEITDNFWENLSMSVSLMWLRLIDNLFRKWMPESRHFD